MKYYSKYYCPNIASMISTGGKEGLFDATFVIPIQCSHS